MARRVLLAAVFVLLATAWGVGWGAISGPVRWAGVGVFAGLAVVNVVRAAGRRDSRS